MYFTLLLGLVVLVAGMTSACSCTLPEPASEAFDNADAVFVGTVTNIGSPSVGSDIWGANSITFEPSRVFKGQSTSELTIQTWKDTAGCGYPFEEGKEYLVYAQHTAQGHEVSLCSRTTDIESADGDLEVINEKAQPIPIASSQTVFGRFITWIRNLFS